VSLFESLLAVAQGVLREATRGHITGGAQPLNDLALLIEQRNGARERPSDAAVHANDPVLQLKRALSPNGLLNRREHLRLVGYRDVRVEPCLRRVRGIRDELLSL
jgi:hypothetical protein